MRAEIIIESNFRNAHVFLFLLKIKGAQAITKSNPGLTL